MTLCATGSMASPRCGACSRTCRWNGSSAYSRLSPACFRLPKLYKALFDRFLVQGTSGRDLAALTDADLQRAGVGSRLLRVQLLNRRDELLLEAEGDDVVGLSPDQMVHKPNAAISALCRVIEAVLAHTGDACACRNNLSAMLTTTVSVMHQEMGLQTQRLSWHSATGARPKSHAP